jgi:hypothetical protein
MLSVKQSGPTFNTKQISLAATARAFGIPPPVSVKKLITVVLRPNTKVFQHSVQTGNVTCDYTLIAGSNGLWTLTGTLRDSSNVLGDNYDISFRIGNGIEIAHASGWLGSQVTGHTTAPISGGGISQDIQAHWPDVLASGVTVHLEATVNAVELTADILGAALVLGIALIFVIGGSGKKSCTNVRWSVTPPSGRPGDPSTPGSGGSVNMYLDDTDCPQ